MDELLFLLLQLQLLIHLGFDFPDSPLVVQFEPVHIPTTLKSNLLLGGGPWEDEAASLRGLVRLVAHSLL